MDFKDIIQQAAQLDQEGGATAPEPTPEPQQTAEPTTQPEPQAAPAPVEPTREPPQMVPVQRLAAATRKAKAYEQQYNEIQQRVSEYDNKIKELETALAQVKKADATDDDAWLDEHLDGGAGAANKTIKALEERLSKFEQWQQAEQQRAVHAQEDSLLSSAMVDLQNDCPNFDEEMIYTLLANKWSPEQIVAKHATMKWAPSPAKAAPARQAPPAPPPQIAQPGTAPKAAANDMPFDQWIKKGFKEDLKRHGIA